MILSGKWSFPQPFLQLTSLADTFLFNNWRSVSVKFHHFWLDSAKAATITITDKNEICQLPLLNAATEYVNGPWRLNFFRGTYGIHFAMSLLCDSFHARYSGDPLSQSSWGEHSLQIKDFSSKSRISPVITDKVVLIGSVLCINDIPSK